jgi:hypothetical protein
MRRRRPLARTSHRHPAATNGEERRGLAAAAALALVLPLAAAGGCVERNIERIGSEEAASIPPPPAPQASPSQGAAAEMATTRLVGSVELDDKLAGAVPANATLYLIVRVAGREGGPPLAVQQVRSPEFPYDFSISERDAMIAGTPLIGEMTLLARLDQDGDAFTTTPGDLLGQTSPVVAGDTGIVVRLTERVGDGTGG